MLPHILSNLLLYFLLVVPVELAAVLQPSPAADRRRRQAVWPAQCRGTTSADGLPAPAPSRVGGSKLKIVGGSRQGGLCDGARLSGVQFLSARRARGRVSDVLTGDRPLSGLCRFVASWIRVHRPHRPTATAAAAATMMMKGAEGRQAASGRRPWRATLAGSRGRRPASLTLLLPCCRRVAPRPPPT